MCIRDSGCVIFVKLWQFTPEDRTRVQLDTNFMQAVPHRDIADVSIMPLYQDEYEQVSIQHWAANSSVTISADGGLEVMVIDGSFIESNDTLESQSWIRLPVGAGLTATTGSEGAKVWVKQNHLKHVGDQIQRVSGAN